MKNIMLVDDDPIFNLLSTLQIKKITPDVQIITFTSAVEALQYLDSNVNNAASLPDLIFLDIRMPQMDGFGFLTAIKERDNAQLNRINVVMLTSSMYESDKEKAAGYCVVKQFLEKPLTAEKFRALNMLTVSNHTHVFPSRIIRKEHRERSRA